MATVTIQPLTPTIDFGNVPVGRTGVQPIELNVVNGQVTIDITGLSGPFSFITKTGLNASGSWKVWLKYSPSKATPVGQLGQAVILHVNLAVPAGSNVVGNPVTLQATPVAAEPRSVSLVLDRSGSMSQQAFGGTRLDTLKKAAPVLLNLLDDNDQVGLVQFSTSASQLTTPLAPAGPLIQVVPPGPFSRPWLDQPLNLLTAQGATSIGSGVQAAATQLGASPHQITVVFTDGEENWPPSIADVKAQGLISGTVYAIGLGTAADLNPAPLVALCNNTNGYMVVTGVGDSPAFEFKLEKYFLRILAGLKNYQIIKDPSVRLLPSESWDLEFPVTGLDSEFTAIVLCASQPELEISLVTPGGEIVPWQQVLAGVTWRVTERMAFVRVDVPSVDLNNAYEGNWRVRVARKPNRDIEARRRHVLENEDENGRGLLVDVSVLNISALSVELQATQSTLLPGAEVRVSALLTLASVPWPFDAAVRIALEWPDGFVSHHDLSKSRPGVFDHSFTAAIPGTYTIQAEVDGLMDDLVAHGVSGQPFTRFAQRTVSVWVPPNGPRPVPGEELPAGGGTDQPTGCLGFIWGWIRRLFRR